ncbi:hypothetical protein GQ42DRAFT_165783 [Ramicandelaber brevisporus]|nr:hypothetical protein GQ42DRAFT_165783 [Ramicandelaber brevisporus]
MGYTTDFTGHFDITPRLDAKHRDYIRAFSSTRRITFEAAGADFPDQPRRAVGLPFGNNGEFYSGPEIRYSDKHVIDHNNPPDSQPSLYCQWTVARDKHGNDILKWDQVEKFYCYTEWLRYLIANFFKPWGYTLNGTVHWQGESDDDTGTITMVNNIISVHGEGVVDYKSRRFPM